MCAVKCTSPKGVLLDNKQVGNTLVCITVAIPSMCALLSVHLLKVSFLITNVCAVKCTSPKGVLFDNKRVRC